MKHTSRFLTALLVCALLVLALAACGSSNADTGEEVSQDSASAAGDHTAAAPQDDSGISFAETTVIDNEDCSITLSDYSDTGIGCTIRAELENKSDSTTYLFSVASASVNGISANPLFAVQVEPGVTEQSTITFSSSDLLDNQVTRFTDIAITFQVCDANDNYAENVVYETIHLYPYGEDQAEVYVRETQSTDNVVIDNDEATVIITGYDPENYWGYGVEVYYVNKTDTELMFSVKDASVNGCEIDPYYAKSVPAGSSAFGTISWSSGSLEKNGIETVEEIVFTLEGQDNTDWSADEYFSEVITLYP